jgi:glucan biosynthesis protein C
MMGFVDAHTTGAKVGAPVQQSTRLHYLDWLRVLAIGGVFLYHAARPFILQEWLIMNETQSAVLSFIFLFFLGSWGMPLFFLLAGASSRFALGRRSGRQYASERVRRLLIPFVAGCLLLSPLQFYLEWVHKGWYDGPFLAFIPVLVQDRLQTLSTTFSPSIFESLGSHLWFLGFLLSFSLLALPLFLGLKSEVGQVVLARLGALGQRPGGLFLFVIPITLTRLSLQGRFPGYTDWSDFGYMLAFFVCGYILYADERLIEAIEREGRMALALGLASTAVMLLALLSGAGRDWVEMPGTAGFYLAWGLASINGWCWTIFVLSLGMNIFNHSNRWLAYGQEAIVPFFLFHQPAIVVIAFYVTGWSVAMPVKLVIIVTGSFGMTLALYELLVRRVGPARAFFGMK